MPEDLLMYSPLAELSALQKLLAGDVGSAHQLCSPLQHHKCEAAHCCLKKKLTNRKSVLIAETDYALCAPTKFTAQRIRKVEKKA